MLACTRIRFALLAAAMKREAHVKYVDELVALQDAEGKRVSGAVLRAIERIWKASGGNLNKFSAMLKALRKKMVVEMATEAKRSQVRAKKLGAQFGKQKDASD